MKALVKPYGKRGLKMVNVPTPQRIGPGDVLIKVLAASVCGTDLHIYESDASIRERVADNQIIGHEFCGEVIGVGSQVTKLAKGDIVSSESHVICGTCAYCQDGLPHLCQEVALLGIDRPGGLAEYVVIPEQNAILKSPHVSVEVAAMMDAYGNAVDTALCVPLIGKSVLVTGCGPQGLMAIAIAMAAGAKQVIATEMYENRIETANKILESYVRPNQTNRRDMILDISKNPDGVVNKIYEATDGLGVDVLLEMSGADRAIKDGLDVLRNAGQAVILGLSSSKKVEIPWTDLIFKGVTIYFRYGRHLYRTWSEGRNLLEFGLVDLEPLIHKPYFALDNFEEAFQLQIDGKVAKVIFKPDL